MDRSLTRPNTTQVLTLDPSISPLIPTKPVVPNTTTTTTTSQPTVMQGGQVMTSGYAASLKAHLMKTRGNVNHRPDGDGMISFNSFITAWFAKLDDGSRLVIFLSYKSLPFMGTEAEIRGREKKNKEASTFEQSEGSRLVKQRNDLVECYIKACNIGRVLPEWNKYPFKGNTSWGAFSRCNELLNFCKGLRDLVFVPYCEHTYLMHEKAFWVRTSFKDAIALIGERFNVSYALLHMYSGEAEPLAKGEKFPGTELINSVDTYIYQNVQPVDKDNLPQFPDKLDTATVGQLSASAVIVDVRLLLQSSELKIAEKNHSADTMIHQIANLMGSYIRAANVSIDLANASIDVNKGSEFTIAYYAARAKLASMLRNLQRSLDARSRMKSPVSVHQVTNLDSNRVMTYSKLM